MLDMLDELPPEIILRVLSYLPIRSVLAFGSTCRTARSYATESVHTLSMGIFTSRATACISHIANDSAFRTVPSSPRPHDEPAVSATKDGNEDEYNYARLLCTIDNKSPPNSSMFDINPHTVDVVVPPDLAYSLSLILTFQDALLSSVVNRYAFSLRHLDLALWFLSPLTAKALVEARNLRSLSLRMHHPYVRHRDVDRRFWDHNSAEGSTIWNTFRGAWSRLDAFRLDGAGITDWQLQCILESNSNLRELRLGKCQLLTWEMWHYLARKWKGREKLRVLAVTACKNLDMDDRVLDYVPALTNLEVLSLTACEHISNEQVEERNSSAWHIKTVHLPDITFEEEYNNDDD